MIARARKFEARLTVSLGSFNFRESTTLPSSSRGLPRLLDNSRRKNAGGTKPPRYYSSRIGIITLAFSSRAVVAMIDSPRARMRACVRARMRACAWIISPFHAIP